MIIEPINGLAWYGEDVECEGRTELGKLTRAQLRQIGAAEDAGAIKVTSASKEERNAMSAALMTDAEWAKAREAAVLDGSWHHGSHEAFLTYARAESDELALLRSLPAEARPETVGEDGETSALTDERIDARLEFLSYNVAVSERYLAHRGDGMNHELAVLHATGGAKYDPREYASASDDAEVARRMKLHAKALNETPTKDA